jgi:hypothetical protein
LEQEEHTPDSTAEAKENSLPIAEGTPEAPFVRPVEIGPPNLPVQEDVHTEPKDKTGESRQPKNREPLLVGVTQDDELSSFERKTVIFARWSLGIATLSLVIAVCVGVFVFNQFKEMAAQTDLLSWSAKQARVEAKNSDIATAKQFKLVSDQFIRDQRPYVTVAVIKPVVKVGEPVMANLYWGNYGKSPAVHVRGIGRIFFGKDALQQADRWFQQMGNKPLLGPETILTPGVPPDPEHSPESSFSSLFSAKPISQEEFSFLMKHDFSAAVVAREEYYDIAGNRYWTDMCWTHFTTGAIPHCAKHNEIH